MKFGIRKATGRGFTLLELLVVIAVTVIVLVIAAPSFQQLIAQQRLKSINAELVTNLQYARTEAVSRDTSIQVKFQSSPTMTCYMVYIHLGVSNCNCLTRPPGNVCVTGYGVELHSTQIPASTDVQVLKYSTSTPELSLSRDGLESTPDDFVVRTSRISGAPGTLQTTVNAMGRPTVCSPDNSVSGVPAC